MLVEESTKKESFRQAVYDSLLFSNPKAAKRFIECQGKVNYLCTNCGNTKAVAQNCESRLCLDCSKRTAGKMIQKLHKKYKTIQKIVGFRLRMITLTIKTDGQYRESIIKLGKSMTKLWNNYLFRGIKGLRRTKGNRVLSGLVSSFEFGEESGNVHAHCLYYGPFIDQEELSIKWKEITKDSMIVDIRLVTDEQKGMIEVLKYVTNLEKCEPSKLVQYYEALKGKRRIRTFGVFFGFDFKDKNFKPEKPACEKCGGKEWINENGFKWQLRKAWANSS